MDSRIKKKGGKWCFDSPLGSGERCFSSEEEAQDELNEDDRAKQSEDEPSNPSPRG